MSDENKYEPSRKILSDKKFLNWRDVANKNGTIELFNYFIYSAEHIDFFHVVPYQERSITIETGGTPLLLIYPAKGNAEEGICLGFNDKNLLKVLGKEISYKVSKGAKKSTVDRSWSYKYVISHEEIDQFLKVLK